MKRIGFLLILSLIAFNTTSFSQVDTLSLRKREISITIDNDLLMLNDFYYTAGHQFSFSQLVSLKKLPNKYFSKSDAVLITYHYGNKIFTPKETLTSYRQEMDRPYAGWNYIGAAITRLNGSHSISKFETEVGLVGRISGMGQIQQWWHKQVGYAIPKGWDSQINNEVVLNLNYQYLNRLRIAKEIDLVSHSGVYVGTGLNKLSQEFTLRLMSFNDLTKSTFYNARICYDKGDDTKEIFLFFSYGLDYIISNIFLEGSLFNNPSPITVDAEQLLIKKSLGLMYSSDKSSFAFEIKNSSREFINGANHGFVRISYARRF